MAATTTTTQRKIELPPPAWGSPAHNALRKAEKEWVVYLRQHASIDASKRHEGKQSKYVDAIDVVVRYTLPPSWELLSSQSPKDGEGEATAVVQKVGDELWKLPEDDKDLIKVLKAGFTPFFQRTGEFSKPSPAFKVPPQKATAVSPPKPLPDLEKGLDHPIDDGAKEDDGTVQPRRGYLPPFVFNFLRRFMAVFFWFFPQSLRSRLYAWWSPILGKPPTTGRR